MLIAVSCIIYLTETYNTAPKQILNFKMFHFRDYVKTENLDGENKYDAGAHGLQVKLITTYYI